MKESRKRIFFFVMTLLSVASLLVVWASLLSADEPKPRYGGKWEGLVQDAPTTATSDVAAPLAQMYCGGGKYYTQMLVPADYVKAIQDAITAPSFNAKQKSVQEAMKLMIDKYCLQIILSSQLLATTVSQAHVHNVGIYETSAAGTWAPESAWLDR